MARVRRLPDALANQIAAGEVVERPASVVKELVENALDAAARTISISIEKSGKERIRVADDGIGMSPEDARVALERHATSKLATAEDLEAIASLGFRGEALPSIASVSHFTLQTREADAQAGYEIVFEGGRLVRETEIGLPPGTIVDVKRLFGNVPARRKFLRADATEASHIAAQVSNLAACYSDVHFRLEHGGRTLLDAPSVRERRERLYQLEKRWVESAVVFEDDVGGLTIGAWLAPPAESRGVATRMHLFVNGRPVKDRILHHAVMEAYRQVSSKSGTPTVYLFLDLPPGQVDVNVHPAKTEVRFSNQQFVHHAVFSALRNALEGKGLARTVTVEARVESEAAREPRAAWPAMTGTAMAEALRFPSPSTSPSRGTREADQETEAPSTPAFFELSETPPTPFGQFRHSYILAADADSLWLVDQHAAHERILYEQLVDRPDDSGRQLLLTPLPLELTASERITMEEELPELAAFGYDIEAFGGSDYVVRAVPGSLAGLDPERLIRAALGEREKECRSSTVREAVSRIAARLACHAAIKVNFELGMEKMQYIVRTLWRARQPSVCPHGRPTTLRLGKEEIERSFGRI